MKRKQQVPKVTAQDTLRVLRELEQSGQVVSRLCPDGRIRWFSTDKRRARGRQPSGFEAWLRGR